MFNFPSLSIIKNIISEQGVMYILFMMMLFTIALPFHVYIKDAFCLCFFFSLFNKYKSSESLLILSFSVVYLIIIIIFNNSTSAFELLSYIVGPITFYFMGRRMVDRSSSSQNTIIAFFLCAIVSCLVIWYNNIIDAIENGIVNTLRLVDIEGRDTTMSATLQGLVVSLGFSGIAVSIFSKRAPIFLVLGILSSVLSLFCVMHLINRTGIIVFALTLIASVFYYSRGNIKHMLIILLLLLVAYYILDYYSIISTDIIDAYDKRNLNSSATAGNRTLIWSNALEQIPKYPFGWDDITFNVGDSGGYAHNLWLDVARRTGWIPLILLLIISIRKFYQLFCLVKIKDDYLIGFLLAITTCIFFSVSMEPVIEGVSSIFYILFFIWGIQQQYYEQINSDYIAYKP